MENNNERSSMEIFEKDQKIAFVDSFSDAVLSYEYEQAGFTINLMQRSVLLFNHNIKKNVMSSTLRKNMISTFIFHIATSGKSTTRCLIADPMMPRSVL